MADLVAFLTNCRGAAEEGRIFVADAGAGKGYLSTQLALKHNIKVLGIDYNPVNTLGALMRQEKLEVCAVKNFRKIYSFPFSFLPLETMENNVPAS